MTRSAIENSVPGIKPLTRWNVIYHFVCLYCYFHACAPCDSWRIPLAICWLYQVWFYCYTFLSVRPYACLCLYHSRNQLFYSKSKNKEVSILCVTLFYILCSKVHKGFDKKILLYSVCVLFAYSFIKKTLMHEYFSEKKGYFFSLDSLIRIWKVTFIRFSISL